MTPFAVRMSESGQGDIDPAWTPSPNAGVYALAAVSDGTSYLAGDFSAVGGGERHALARIATEGAVEGPATDALLPGTVNAIAIQPNGAAIIGGEFTYAAGGQSWGNLLRVQPTGVIDTAWKPRPDGHVRAVAVGADGSVYVGGLFTSIGGQPRILVAKLAGGGNGAADPAWNPSLGVALQGIGVSAIVLDNQSHVYVGGEFWGAYAGGVYLYGVARLAAGDDGALDPDWHAVSARSVASIAVAADATVYVAGDFFWCEGGPCNHVAKVSQTGAIDPGWNPAPDGTVTSIAVERATLNVFVAGGFTTVGGQPRYHLAKLDGASGMADPQWIHVPDSLAGWPSSGGLSDASALALDGEGHLYFGGVFDAIDGYPIAFLAKLPTEGAGLADPSWNPSPGIHDIVPGRSSTWQPPVQALATNSAGTVFVGGYFTEIGAQLRNGLTAVSPVPLPARNMANGFEVE